MLTPEERERGRRLGALLRQARGERSMAVVAAASGIPVETLRRIETGRVVAPGFFTVAALADVLGLELSRLSDLLDATGPDAGDVGVATA